MMIPLETRHPLEHPGIQLPATAKLATASQIDDLSQELDGGALEAGNNSGAYANSMANNMANNAGNFQNANPRPRPRQTSAEAKADLVRIFTWIGALVASAVLAGKLGRLETYDCPKSTKAKPLVRYSCELPTWACLMGFIVYVAKITDFMWRMQKKAPLGQRRAGKVLIKALEPIVVCMAGGVLSRGFILYIGCIDGCVKDWARSPKMFESAQGGSREI
jgi:hypothetical protein